MRKLHGTAKGQLGLRELIAMAASSGQVGLTDIGGAAGMGSGHSKIITRRADIYPVNRARNIQTVLTKKNQREYSRSNIALRK